MIKKIFEEAKTVKSSFFKYIFIFFVIGIIISTIYFVYFRKEEKHEEIVESEVESIDEKKDLRMRYF